jgi:FK506-binding protein 1
MRWVLADTNLCDRYTGWLRTAGQPEEKGKQFDSTTGRGSFQTPIGVGRVIKGTSIHTRYKQACCGEDVTNDTTGWDEGVVQMKLGEKARLDITSDFAYGSQSFPGLIPPNSDLILYVHQAIYNGPQTDLCIARLSSRRSTKQIVSVMDVAYEQPGI